MLAVFAQADVGVVQKAITAISSLTDLAACADAAALRSNHPLPRNTEMRNKIAYVRDNLAEVDALAKTGRYREGLELARKLEKMANVVSYRPVQVEVLFELGRLLEHVGDYRRAEATLLEASRVAGEIKDSLIAAKAMTWLIWVVGYQQARYKEALVFAHDAQVMLGVAGGNEILRAQIVKNIGVVRRYMGDYDGALSCYRKSLAIFEKLLGPEHPSVGSTYNNMGIVYKRQGEYTQALEAFMKTLAIDKRSLGPKHPSVGSTLNNIGLVYRRQGNLKQALDAFQSAIAIREKSQGHNHSGIANPIFNLGNIYADKGDYDKALECYHRAGTIWEKSLGRNHPKFALFLESMASVNRKRDEYDKALALYREALAIRESVLGATHPDILWSLAGIGQTMLDGDRPMPAKNDYERAVAICNKSTCEIEPFRRFSLVLRGP